MASMNGKKCRIVGPLNKHEQRYPVFVCDTKEVVLIKPSNLMLLRSHQNDHSANRSKWKDRVREDVVHHHVDDRKENEGEKARRHDVNLMKNSMKFPLLNGLKGREYRLKDNATILFYERFLEESRVQSLWKELMSTLSWEQSQFNIRGRSVLTPRLQSWMRDDGITNEMASLYQTQAGHSWSESILLIKNTIEKLLHCTFHYVLINYYRDGKDSIAFHSDTEAKPRCKNVVGSVSLGGPRRFLLKHVESKHMGILGKREFLLPSGCLLVMKDDTQIKWKHAVPKDKKYQNPRINLTFRQVCDCKSCSK